MKTHFFFITDRYADDIGHLETHLLEDFRIFSSEYDRVVKDDLKRKKFFFPNMFCFIC